ncbi:hypothetical protein [Halosimplex pelagicum]|uniref:Uncharacterized protein n=1 Tax=Halosimplex pelagicum TaxID=869886 RepID=A0A7D5P6M4_9EURY|nr:hypothetical protein [Halosimplex pelagicum]QLH82043.1 hypothetical protein HZS54_10600 [Halosimplex pelagicum]
MSEVPNRRSILQSIGVGLSVGIAGCTVLGGDGLDVSIQNQNSESHKVSVTISDFTESATLDPDTSETFANVLAYPDYPTEQEATIQMDKDWENTYKFTLGEDLKAFILNIGAEGEVSYTLDGR